MRDRRVLNTALWSCLFSKACGHVCSGERGQCQTFDVKQAANFPLLLLQIDNVESEP